MSSQLFIFSDEELHQPPRNQRQAFLYYMSNLDIEMIELILDDHKTYQDASKAIFIKKLEEIFEEFQESGDTKLNLLNGECNNCYKSCKGYSFIGNTSANYLNLLVEGSSTEILDISYCSDFGIYEKNINLNYGMYIHIYDDEKPDFVPNPYYIETKTQIEEALEELDYILKISIDFNTIKEWLENYHSIASKHIFNVYLSHQFRLFSLLYYKIEDVSKLYHLNDRIKNAMQIYRKTIANRVDEKRLIQWLLGFEDLYLENLYKHLDVFGDEYEDDYVYFDKQKNYRIAKSNFQEQIEFYNIFCNKYDKMTNKYENTKNISKFYENDEEYKSSILRFYLEESDYFK
jgi:hypothetical protein